MLVYLTVCVSQNPNEKTPAHIPGLVEKQAMAQEMRSPSHSDPAE